MREGEDCDKTYAPVASWMSIRLLLTFVVALGWHMEQVDYIAAYTQVLIDRDMYMEFPRGFTVPGGVDRKHLSWNSIIIFMDRNKPGECGINIYASDSSRKLDLCSPNMTSAYFSGGK